MLQKFHLKNINDNTFLLKDSIMTIRDQRVQCFEMYVALSLKQTISRNHLMIVSKLAPIEFQISVTF